MAVQFDCHIYLQYVSEKYEYLYCVYMYYPLLFKYIMFQTDPHVQCISWSHAPFWHNISLVVFVVFTNMAFLGYFSKYGFSVEVVAVLSSWNMVHVPSLYVRFESAVHFQIQLEQQYSTVTMTCHTRALRYRLYVV